MKAPNQMFVAAAVAAIAGVAATAQDAAFSAHKVGVAEAMSAGAIGLAMHGDSLFAVGNDYKARFRRSGVEFTPALGSKAPHNLPLRLALQSVRRGTTTVHTAAGDVDARQADAAVVYDHGSIDERYDVRPEGLEQSFVFEQRLEGDGDLVVRCEFATELQPRVGSDGTVSFLWPDLGGVHVGKVTGVDADGDRIEGSLRLDGNALELVLPDAFVDTAAFPLTLDPLIGTEFTVYDTNDSYDSDVAYDDTNLRYLVVFNRRYSFTDIDVYGIRVSTSGGIVGGVIFVDVLVSTVKRPRVATVSASDRFLVVWQTSGSPLGPWNIKCAAVNGSDGAVSNLVDVVATAADEFNPSVGGDATTTDNEAVVVWETDAGIDACQVTVLATGDPTVLGVVNIVGTPLANNPAISKACGALARHVITWQTTGLADAEITAQLVTRNLGLIGGALTVSANTVTDGRPAVDGDGATYMVAWERTEASPSTTRDIVCARLAASAGGLAIAVPATPVEATANEEEYDPDVAYLGSRFCITYAERSAALFDDCFAWLVNPDCSTCNAKVFLDGLNGANWNRESAPRVGATWIYDDRDSALISFSEALNVPPFTSRVIGQRIENQSAGSPVVNAGGGCGLGGNASTFGGPFVVGNSAFEFRLQGADPAAILFLSIGFPGAGLFCGACTLADPLSFVFQLNQAGNSSSPYPVPCDPGFVGLGLEFQWVSFNTAFNPCPLAAGLSASQRLRITMTN